MIRLTAQIDADIAGMAGQVPFAASLALNRTAVGARDVVRENLPKRFKLRNNWTLGGVQAVMSSKINLTAQVTAPGYLAIHETGGTMHPTSSSLLAAKAPGVTRRILGNRERTFRKDMGEHGAVFRRAGRKGRSIKLLAWLSPEHDFDERLHMEDEVQAHVRDRFSANFADALEQALATGRVARAR